MKIMVWRVFECMIFVYNVIISNT